MVFVEMLLFVAEVAVLGLPLADSEVAVLADFDAIVGDFLLLDILLGLAHKGHFLLHDRVLICHVLLVDRGGRHGVFRGE